MGIYRDAYAGRHGVISEVQVEAVSADTQTHSEQKAPQELGVVDMTGTVVVDVQSHAHACEAAMSTHPTGSHTVTHMQCHLQTLGEAPGVRKLAGVNGRAMAPAPAEGGVLSSSKDQAVQWFWHAVSEDQEVPYSGHWGCEDLQGRRLLRSAPSSAT